MLPDFRIRQRDYLLEITRALTEELDLNNLLERILNVSVELLAGQAGLITLRDADTGWRVAAAHGIQPAFLRYLEPLLSEVKDTPLPDESEIVEVNRLLNNLTYTASMGLLTGVGLPLVSRQRVVGVIFIFRNYAERFSSNDRILLSSFAQQAAIAVRNAQLYTQVNEEKKRLDALLDSAADGILILSSDHRIERCNAAFTRMYGAPADAIQNQKHEKIIQWAGQVNGLTLEKAEAGGWPLTPHAQLYVEGDLVRPGQTKLPIGITYAPLLTANNVLVNVIATVRDITRFREADELKSTFISIISHELKTPVALIKGYVSTLRREDARWDRSVIEESLGVIEDEADHLTEMIENLLDASRLQAGGFKLKLCDVDIAELADQIVKRFQTQTTRHKLVMDIPKDFPIIMGDDERLRQVLTNLVSNSIRYAPKGEIRISGQTRPEQVIICVSDEGPGIAAEDIPHIFDRFYRAPDMARQTKGAGLGLYLARSIVEAHGGRIWVDPSPDSGARICFSLPRQEVRV
jgi:signal transduction histidine kinase